MTIIRCQKCGKVYDYDKYNGICPNCARYNRATTGMQLEQELHDRYDTTYGAGGGAGPSDVDRTRRRPNGFLCVIGIIIVLIVVMAILQ